MPAKNTTKIYVADGIYHVYNRGVEKRKLFLSELDYHVFLNHLKEALLPPEKILPITKNFSVRGTSFRAEKRKPKNFFGQISLLAYCLMPNHFHFLIQQTAMRSIDHFMQSIATRYSIYFNKAHNRRGSLFETVYKANMVNKDEYLLHVSRYIHRNPALLYDNLSEAYSSYGEYLGKRATEWVNTQMVLSYFKPGSVLFLKHINTYKSFVENSAVQTPPDLVTLEDDDEIK